jgi:AraC-like DNA-binding protein
MLQLPGVDEGRALFRRLYGEGVVEPGSGGAFGGSVELFQIGSMSFASGAWGPAFSVAAPLIQERHVVSVASADGASGEHGGVPFSLVPGRSGVIYSPGQGMRLDIGPGYRARTVCISRAAMEAHLVALTGEPARGGIRFDAALDLEVGAGAVITGICSLLGDELGRPGASPLVLIALREAFMTSLLTGFTHSASSLFEAPPARIAPRHVRRAEEYIEANAARPITLADIAAASEVSARSLQVGFKEYRGITPMEFLRRRRFDLVRHRLLSADPGQTVADLVAGTSLGGASGRFSVEYRKRFGESPSETLARARGGGPLAVDLDPRRG